MKNKRIVMLSVFTALMLGNTKVSAEMYGDTLKYIISSDRAVITGFNGSPQVLDIPSVIDGKDVKEIRENAFYKCDSLKKVVIPETVSVIGHHAFYECTSLEEIDIQPEFVEIGDGAFEECKLLADKVQPDNDMIPATETAVKLKKVSHTKSASAIILSVIGLLFLKFSDNLKKYRKKYDYEY